MTDYHKVVEELQAMNQATDRITYAIRELRELTHDRLGELESQLDLTRRQQQQAILLLAAAADLSK